MGSSSTSSSSSDEKKNPLYYVILVICCIVVIYVKEKYGIDLLNPPSSQKHKNTTTLISYRGHSLMGRNNSVAYAVCDSGWTCATNLDYFYSNGTLDSRRCSQTFPTHAKHLSLRSMHAKKLVFVYALREKKTYLVFRVVYVANLPKCRFYEAKVPLSNASLASNPYSEMIIKNTYVLSYDDNTHDAFVYDKKQCSGARCKISFDSTGNLIGNPVPYLSNDRSIYDVEMLPANYKSSPKSFFAVLRHYVKKSSNSTKIDDYPTKPYVLTVVHAEPGGKTTELLNVNDKNKPYGLSTKNSLMDIDDSNKQFGICYSANPDNSKVQCVKYDSQLNKTLDTLVNLGYPMMKVKIHNFEKDKLHLITARCFDRSCKRHNKKLEKRSVRSKGSVKLINRFRAAACGEHWYDAFNMNDNCVFVECQNRSKHNVFIRCTIGKKVKTLDYSIKV